jgi:hypothetical protein
MEKCWFLQLGASVTAVRTHTGGYPNICSQYSPTCCSNATNSMNIDASAWLQNLTASCQGGCWAGQILSRPRKHMIFLSTWYPYTFFKMSSITRDCMITRLTNSLTNR